jgi:hypothetical protein
LIYAGDIGPRRVAMLAIALAFSFTALVLAVLAALPLPHTRGHYLFAGAVPTLLGLSAVLIWLRRAPAARSGPRPVSRAATGHPPA